MSGITNFTFATRSNGNTLQASDLDSTFSAVRAVLDQLIDQNNRTPLMPIGSTGIVQIPALVTNSLLYVDANGNVTLLSKSALDDAVAAASASAEQAEISAESSMSGALASSPSSSNITIASGPVSLGVTPGSPFSVNQWVSISYSVSPTTKWLNGAITAYDAITGAMTVQVTSFYGSGSASDWTVAASSPINLAGALLVPQDVPGTSQNLSSGGHYIFKNTGAQTLGLLPPSPNDGDVITYENATTRSDLTLQRNGKLFMGLAEDHTVTRQATYTIRYSAALGDWRFM